MTEFDTRWQQELATPRSNVTKGYTVPLENGAFFPDAPLSLGEPVFVSVEGKGMDSSVIVATHDFGDNNYVMGSRALKGARSHYEMFRIGVDHGMSPAVLSGLPRRTDGSLIYMTGLRVPGGGTKVDSVAVGACQYGLDISADHVTVLDTRISSCKWGAMFGLDERQEASHYLARNDLTDNSRASIGVFASNVYGGFESHSDHLGFCPIGIEGLTRDTLNPAYEWNQLAVSGGKFFGLMVEAIGNHFILAPDKRVLGNKFYDTDVSQIWNPSRRDPNLGQSWVTCWLYDQNIEYGAPWLAFPPPGPDPYIVCAGGTGNVIHIPNLPNLPKPLMGPGSLYKAADGVTPANGPYGMTVYETTTGRRGKLVNLVEGSVKKNEFMGAKLSNYRMRRHPGDSSPVYGTAAQDGTAGQWILMWERGIGGGEFASDDPALASGNDFMIGVSPSAPGKAVKVSSWSDALARSTGGLVSNPSRIQGPWL